MFVDKDYFTRDELQERWSCTSEQLAMSIANGDLIPVRYTNPNEAVIVHFDDETGELIEDDDDEMSTSGRPWQGRGFMYLRFPERVSPTDWAFMYGCSHPDDSMTLESCHAIRWVKFNSQIAADSPEVVFLAPQVFQFDQRLQASMEDKNADVRSEETVGNAEEITGKTRTCYINIIGALCEEYWRAKYPDSSRIIQDHLIMDLIKKYHGFPGMSERNLKGVLSTAIKAIQQG